LAKAAEAIGRGDPAVREIMNRNCNVPKPLQDTYPIPAFPAPAVPDRDKVEAAVKWLTDKGVLESELSYDRIVDGGFLR
jgi:NitT/TauT family transport system substrate-binding protein